VVAKADGSVIQKNHYYPFGAPFAESTEQGVQPYKYGSKEFDTMHGLNQYDFHARQYDPAIGRFTTPDPLAEKYYSWSPYVYCYNNPLKFVDPDGKQGIAGPGYIRIFTPEQNEKYAPNAAREALKSTDLNDIAVVASGIVAIFTGGNPVNVDGSEATWDDFNVAKSGLLLPLVSGSGAKKGIDTAEDIVEGASSTYNNITKSSRGKESIKNIETNVTKKEFDKNLTEAGYTKTTSKDGKAVIYVNEDGKKYTVRNENSSGHTGSTADYTRPDEDKASKKIRLND